ncbi:MAG: DsbA family protein [Rhodobacteraceae bacterium]|nr:DsbA family protein [Paracoccaceae bacterium]
MNRFTMIAAAALVLLGGAYYWQNSNSTGLPTLGMAEAQEADAEIDKSLVEEMVLGAEDAPLTVIEYASYTCPHCKNFHQDTLKQFKTEYIDTGKVRFVYREVYFDRFSLWAGMVARCKPAAMESTGTETAAEAAATTATAGDRAEEVSIYPNDDVRRYFGIADMIYAQQAEWTKGNPGAVADNLAKIGRTAGLTGEEIDACLQNEDIARAMIAVYQENAEEHGIRSTPSFIIDGELTTGAMSYADFSALIDAKLGG